MHALSLLLLQMLYLSLSWWLQYYTINYTGSDIVVWLLFTEFTCMWVLVCTEPSFPGRISKFEPLHQSSISDGKSVIKLDLGVAVEALGMSGRPRSGRSGKPGREVTGRRVLKTPLFRASLLTFSHWFHHWFHHVSPIFFRLFNFETNLWGWLGAWNSPYSSACNAQLPKLFDYWRRPIPKLPWLNNPSLSP